MSGGRCSMYDSLDNSALKPLPTTAYQYTHRRGHGQAG
ncbi:hypothetical protein DFAR_3480016 [Desulfarculales bacterium]